MENANWLVSEIGSLFGSAIWNFFGNGLFYGIFGLLLGLFLVYRWNKKKAFSRPNKLWSLIAKFHLLYLPVLLALLMGFFGSTYGLQKTINGWISSSTEATQNYAVSYVPQIEQIGQQLIATKNSSEEAIGDIIQENKNLPSNPLAKKFYVWMNRNIISYATNALGFSDDADGIKKMVESNKLATLNASMFGGLSTYLQGTFMGSFMTPVYISLLMTFLPFILIPLVEFFLYRLKGKVSPNKA